jgi:hypothetical protein
MMDECIGLMSPIRIPLIVQYIGSAMPIKRS